MGMGIIVGCSEESRKALLNISTSGNVRRSMTERLVAEFHNFFKLVAFLSCSFGT